ncbi:hypothetical protein LTR85_002157 [Meristemomyces frigidus]|nr:hypothetical protein LTR85_002157 [Meristemomyces frigidus]
MSRPSLVLVRGLWHCPAHFDKLTKILEEHGYKCVPVSLPSTQSSDLPPATLADDTKAVRDTVKGELDTGNNVVVVAHSYGGTPTNNGLQGLDKKTRTEAAAGTAVTEIAFLCAIPLPAGVSFITGLGGSPHSIHDLSKNPDFLEVGDPGPAHRFYHDMSIEDQKRYSALIRPQSWKAYQGETECAAYMAIPSWYLYCTEDRAFPFGAQQGLIGAAIAAGAQIRTETMEASHSPFLSMPAKTAEFIMRAASEQE